MRIFFKLLPLTVLMFGCASKSNKSSSVEEESFELVYAHKLIQWEDLLKQNCDDYYGYVYSLTCHYCNEIKPQVYSFCLRNNVFFVEYQIDVVPLKSEAIDFKGIDKIEDLFILGTPTLFHVQNQKISDCFIGANQITKFFDTQK